MRKGIKNIFHINRDTDVDRLMSEILQSTENYKEYLLWLQNKLQPKKAGNYYTIVIEAKTKDGELDNMLAFFHGAVVEYYVRQSKDIWRYNLDRELLEQAKDEIKQQVGFYKYDHLGKVTEEVGSLAYFERTEELNEFLKEVEAVCFDDNDYIFPDSERYLRLVAQKGKASAKRQVISELHTKIKNKYFKQEIV